VDAQRRVDAFARDRGREGEGLLKLATHAALPVVLNADVVHLLRINYFLDPPNTLPYAAEAQLLLSPLCTEIGDGFYVIDPDVRDVLLHRLLQDARFGGARLRDVARLLWEYSGTGAPWQERPGLTEAQQLTALNFIDPPRALNWLDRARRAEGAAPVADDRWFVALERELVDRAAAVEEATEKPVFLPATLPALAELRDALAGIYHSPVTAFAIASELGLPLEDVSSEMPATRVWQALLDVAWLVNRVGDVLAAIERDRPRDRAVTRAIQEYWIRLSPALRVENGSFVTPPPEWQVLERYRTTIESALRSLVILRVEPDENGLFYYGNGFLVGNWVVVTHRSVVQFGSADPAGGFKPGLKMFAEFAADHPVWPDASSPSSESRVPLTLAAYDAESEVVLLQPDWLASPPRRETRPLRAAKQASNQPVGRVVVVTGYAQRDQRSDPAVLSRIMADVYNVLRVHVGRITAIESPPLRVAHNCFTSTGTGGSPLIDLETGEVLAVHFAARYDPGPYGLKQGHAAPLWPLVGRPEFEDVFSERRAPVAAATAPAVFPPLDALDEIFVDRASQQQTFIRLLEAPASEAVLLIEGDAGIGKTRLLRQFSRIAEQRGIPQVLLSARNAFSSSEEPDLPARLRGELSETLRVRSTDSAVVIIDNVEMGDRNTDEIYRDVHQIKSELAIRRILLVLAGRKVTMWRRALAPDVQVEILRLGGLDAAGIAEWLKTIGVPSDPRFVRTVESVSQGRTDRIQQVVAALQAIGIRPGGVPVTPAPSQPNLMMMAVAGPPLGSVEINDSTEHHGPFVVTRGVHTLNPPAQFAMGLFPVTTDIYGEFVRAGAYDRDEFWPGVPDAARRGMVCRDRTTKGPSTWRSATTPDAAPDHPVAGISYYEATAFIEWLRWIIKPLIGRQWMLPSEDMWEFAARGTGAFLYPWGMQYESGRCNCVDAGLGGTSPVEKYPTGKSPFGCYDMAGNVWEFVDASDADASTCVLRGGSFVNTPDEVKTSLRLVRVPKDHRAHDFGLRCAVSF
jgi:formylglycine-generating enzyme required for sulfatase activity